VHNTIERGDALFFKNFGWEFHDGRLGKEGNPACGPKHAILQMASSAHRSFRRTYGKCKQMRPLERLRSCRCISWNSIILDSVLGPNRFSCGYDKPGDSTTWPS
jgi:hypothetical protein